MHILLTSTNPTYSTHESRLSDLKTIPSILDLNLWTDIANLGTVEQYLTNQQKLWRQYSMETEPPSSDLLPPSQNIENYLHDKETNLITFSIPRPSVEEYSINSRLFQVLESDIQVLYKHADEIAVLRGKHSALDSYLLEKLPFLYENEPLSVRKGGVGNLFGN
jgi:hypothetical protein